MEPESALSAADTVTVAGIMANVTRVIVHHMPEMLKVSMSFLTDYRKCVFTNGVMQDLEEHGVTPGL